MSSKQTIVEYFQHQFKNDVWFVAGDSDKITFPVLLGKPRPAMKDMQRRAFELEHQLWFRCSLFYAVLLDQASHYSGNKVSEHFESFMPCPKFFGILGGHHNAHPWLVMRCSCHLVRDDASIEQHIADFRILGDYCADQFVRYAPGAGETIWDATSGNQINEKGWLGIRVDNKLQQKLLDGWRDYLVGSFRLAFN